MKRGLAIFFLLLANITLLVHAAVPHHNHEGDFCFISTGCETECSDHEQHHQHEHHGDHGDMKCDLDTKVIIPSNVNPKQEIAVLELMHLPLVNFNFIKLLQIESKHYLSLRDYKRQIPLKLSLYCLYATCSTGLRAPPSFV